MWVYLVLLFGIFKGLREGVKKKALEKNSIAEVLFFHALMAFIILLPFTDGIILSDKSYYAYIFLKSFVVFAAWIFAFNSIKMMPVSLYGVIDLSRVLFGTAFGVFILHESMTLNKTIGLLLVLVGLLSLNFMKKGGGDEVKFRYIVFAIFSCFLNAVSGLLDKLLMSGTDITSGQLQFWYMFFLVLLYFIYTVSTKTKLSIKTLKTNPWIIILSVLFIIADRALFIANKDPYSQITIMTLLKQSSVIVTILVGKLFFNEKNILIKLLCAAVVVAGITIAVI